MSACTANEGPVRIQYNVCFLVMYSQKWNCAASLFPKHNYNVKSPNSYTYRCVRDLIFPGSVCLFAAAKYVDRSWEYKNRSQTHECGNWDWDRAIPRKGIHKWDFRCRAADFLICEKIKKLFVWKNSVLYLQKNLHNCCWEKLGCSSGFT
jgi:hypothetical protein